eukprot:11511559-Alexandrium_andersonii.AAC.1
MRTGDPARPRGSPQAPVRGKQDYSDAAFAQARVVRLGTSVASSTTASRVRRSPRASVRGSA